MDALTRPFEAGRSPHGPVLPFPGWLLLPLAGVGVAALLSGPVLGAPARVLGVVGCHGGLLAASLAAAWDGRTGWGGPAAALATAFLLAGSAANWSPWGGLAYLLPPVALAHVAWRHAEGGRLGLVPPPWQGLAAGLAAGSFLGAHLLLSASRTLGYPVGGRPLGAYLGDVLYDAGANVLSAECFFRGTLFDRWQRRWGFWPAALAATGLCLLRYLLDPALPRAVELLTGAVFYLALLSVSSCALLWRFASLLPSVTAGLVFFAAYRLLPVR